MITDQAILSKMITIQKGEITEHHFYRRVAKKQKSQKNKDLLNHIADVEREHYQFWEQYTKMNFEPNWWKVSFYSIIVFIFGLTFGVRLMEKSQKRVKNLYYDLDPKIDGLQHIIKEEEEHEQGHIDEIDEERLMFIGSIVLGLNDALVEFTGTLAGLTFAFSNARYIALAGLIAGIAASLSMASSEYLATKQDGKGNIALQSAIYTGLAYIVTVALMILPYLLLSNVFICLFIMIGVVVTIIFVFNYYISIAQNINFKRRFIEMLCISLGVACLSFIIGVIVRMTLGIDI